MRDENIPGALAAGLPASPDRRRRMQWLAAALGLSVLPAHAALLMDPAPVAVSSVLAPDQRALLDSVAELILPRTDTPGALDAGVPAFLERYLSLCARPAEATRVRSTLARLDEAARAQHQRRFLQLSAPAQTAMLQAADLGQSPFSGADQSAFRHLKGLVLFAYYTSEPGASVELSYLPIPGGYRGNLPFADVGRAWSL